LYLTTAKERQRHCTTFFAVPRIEKTDDDHKGARRWRCASECASIEWSIIIDTTQPQRCSSADTSTLTIIVTTACR
jgi:hypothetical protein